MACDSWREKICCVVMGMTGDTCNPLHVYTATQEETKQNTSGQNILGKKLRFEAPQNVGFPVDERLQKHNL